MTGKIRAAKAIVLPEGEGPILVAFVAIPVIWTSLIVPMIYCDICLRSLSLALGAAALVGMGAGAVREFVIGRTDH